MALMKFAVAALLQLLVVSQGRLGNEGLHVHETTWCRHQNVRSRGSYLVHMETGQPVKFETLEEAKTACTSIEYQFQGCEAIEWRGSKGFHLVNSAVLQGNANNHNIYIEGPCPQIVDWCMTEGMMLGTSDPTTKVVEGAETFADVTNAKQMCEKEIDCKGFVKKVGNERYTLLYSSHGFLKFSDYPGVQSWKKNRC